MNAGAPGRPKAGRAPAGPGSRGARGRSPVSRTSELAKKRERRSFRFRLIAFLGLLLILMLAGLYQFWLRDSSLVSVKNLEIVGVSTKTEEGRQIDQAVRSAMGEMTTLNVDPGLLDQELARFPRVASTEIKTKLPDSATVTVVMREDGSIFGEGAGALLIATDGTVLGPADGQESSLPLITDGDPPPANGDSSGDGSAAGTTLTGRALNQALILGATPAAMRPYVKDSRSTPEGVVVTLDDGLTMLFGDAAHADQKWRAAAALIADPNFDTSGYVDLTVPRRPGVSSEIPDFSAGEAPPTGATDEASAG